MSVNSRDHQFRNLRGKVPDKTDGRADLRFGASVADEGVMHAGFVGAVARAAAGKWQWVTLGVE